MIAVIVSQTTSGAVAYSAIQFVSGPRGAKGDTGERGPQGEQGIQGPKGDTGDLTPELIAARDAAQAAATTASTAASTATGAASTASADAATATGAATTATDAAAAAQGSATSAATSASTAADASARAVQLSLGEYTVFIEDDEAITAGGYPVTRSARYAGTMVRFYGEVLEGTSATVTVERNGTVVHGPVPIAFGTPVSQNVSIAVAKGDRITYNVVADAKRLWLQMDGGDA